jgi:molybdopterin molybdotransferase
MLAAPLPAGGARETFMRAQRIGSQASPLAHQDSGAQAPLAQADLLVRCASHAPARTRGDLVDVLDF